MQLWPDAELDMLFQMSSFKFLQFDVMNDEIYDWYEILVIDAHMLSDIDFPVRRRNNSWV